MSEVGLKSISAFAGHLDHAVPPASGPAGITVTPRDNIVLATVMAHNGKDAAFAQKVQSLFGIAVPTGPKRVTKGSVSFIGMGPGQWTVVDEAGHPHSFAANLAKEFAGLASVSDQSDARAVIRVSGPKARAVLAKGLFLDLHPRVFKPGDAALSAIALIGSHIWQIDETPTYEISVFRSMAGSFAHFLLDAGAEFGVEIGS